MKNHIDSGIENALAQAKIWFKEKIIAGHISNTEKLRKSSEFNINPFLALYLSVFLTGKVSNDGIARGLVYARALGTSITTSFGQNIQSFISEILVGAFGSPVEGLDIEFIDKVDQRKKYAQIKLGPNTINKDDVETIHNHFRGIRNRSRTNANAIQLNDLVIGVMYGKTENLSSHYKKLRDKYNYPIFIGNEFWHRLTGDETFFSKLIQAITDTLNEAHTPELLESVIKDLSQSKEIQELALLNTESKTDWME